MNTRRAFIVFAFVVSLCVCALLFLNPATVSSIAAYAFIRRGNIKTILYWNQFSGDYSFYLGEGYVAQNCPRFNNCFATHSRFIQSVDSFDAIVFHHGIHDELTYRDLPTSRRPEQKYVFVALKSPANQYISNRFNNLFNATMTYQLNSDIIWTYADMIDLAEEQMVAVPSRTEFKWKTIDSGYEEKDIVEELEEEQLIRKIIAKRKLAVWYRNNCETPSNRENYVAELEKYAPIDKYGKCSDDSTNCLKDADCFKTHVEPNYFFYLAFEDSLCDDYVTETLYNALKYNVVPVVYGGANYNRFAPPKSYVNALDFNTPNDLAEYLAYLSHNVSEYKKYFDWKKQYRVASSRQRIICDLCEMLNTDYQKRSYDISDWYGMKRCPLQHQLTKQISSGGSNYATKKTLYLQR